MGTGIIAEPKRVEPLWGLDKNVIYFFSKSFLRDLVIPLSNTFLSLSCIVNFQKVFKAQNWAHACWNSVEGLLLRDF